MTKTDIRIGNIFSELPKIGNDEIDLVITSPPYWGLRDYGVDGQLGNEPTMEAYLDNTMRWVKEVWRVLKPTGSFVLNLGDTFVNPSSGGANNKQYGSIGNLSNSDQFAERQWRNLNGHGLGGIYKKKQLLSVSSFAYCKIVSETDFVCRGEHIWAKPNVPTPIRNRLKHSHEKLFWFVKNADKYYFDNKVWLNPIKQTTTSRYDRAITENSVLEQGAFKSGHRIKISNKNALNIGITNKTSMWVKGEYQPPENVIEHSWRIIPCGEKQHGFELHEKPISEHIAPFPTTLIRPYIKSLCPANGVVLDTFLGSGTTMRVCLEEQRDCIGIELNEKYAEYAKKRVNEGGRLS